MRRSIFAASVAAAALIPSIAYAQSSCERQRSDQVVGTVAGAVVGGVLGNVIAGPGDRAIGTIIGAGAGGVIGNQVTKPDRDCSHAFGYYDDNNRWHATGVSSSDARGYYDRNGGWVDGSPNGYYGENNRWISNANMAGQDGSYSPQGGWVPASVDGYYDRNDLWVAGTASGYYDGRGRWVAGVTTGHYDARGAWISGAASGHRDANGAWVADPQPGYYDSNGRWKAGETYGYYDSRGRWVATSIDTSGGDRAGPGRAILQQVSWLERYIRSADSHNSLARGQASGALRELGSIRGMERNMRHDRGGALSDRDEARLQARLDRLTGRLQISRR